MKNSLLGNDFVILTVKMGTFYDIRRKLQKGLCSIFRFKIMTLLYYRLEMRRKLNLKEPKLFSEKVCWYKLYYCPNNQQLIKCSDKYKIREYLSDKGLGKYMPNQLFVWDSPNQIEWEKLPNKHVLKCSHGCAYNIICFDKDQLDEAAVKKILLNWQKDSFGLYNAEPHYVKSHKYSKVICEEYIDSNQRLPIDYKVHCMNGNAKYILTCSERTANHTTLFFFDCFGQPLDYGYEVASKPIILDEEILREMISISNSIAKDFPFVRVDFYVQNGGLRIGELTFTPAAGYITYITAEADRVIGEMFDISGL